MDDLDWTQCAKLAWCFLIIKFGFIWPLHTVLTNLNMINKINKRMDNPTPETIYHVNIKKCDLA